MARMPTATFVREESDRVPMSRFDIVCIHTMGFKNNHQPAHKAHFSVAADGTIFQSRDTQFKSKANGNGNRRTIAIENEDSGPPFPEWQLPNVPDFTEPQVEANAQICAWAAKTHGIPLVPCPDSRSSSRGIAYHRQGVPGNFFPPTFKFAGVVDGGEIWTDLPGGFGKSCPGDRRIATTLERIIPRAVQIAGGAVAVAAVAAPVRQTAIAEAADMLVGQDKKTGKIWVISGNTKLQLRPGGATASGDKHSAGNTGHKSVDAILKMIGEMYPGSNPKFVALDPDTVELMREVDAP